MLNSSGARAWDSNRFYRDFDFFAYKYALIASVGSAGLNSIVNTLPARDAEEYDKFPAADLAFIKTWLGWTDTHRDLLRSQRALPIAPGHGKVDGELRVPRRTSGCHARRTSQRARASSFCSIRTASG